MTIAELQQKVNLKASNNMVLIPQHWSFRGEYSQDKNEMGKFAWKLTNFIKRDGTVKIRRSSRENRMIRKRVRLKLRTHDNIYGTGRWCGHRGERKDGEKEEGSQQDGEKSTTWRSGRTCQNERNSDCVGEDRNKMVLTT
ncbi:uncharacterized protein TNCV_3047921 [Trichonephila clavipes]|nr:uncharacterized protein TNCV_3047921 [Trichonephila clavipes]